MLSASITEEAESQSGLFGGNSNWRGPIWFPVNLWWSLHYGASHQTGWTGLVAKLIQPHKH